VKAGRYCGLSVAEPYGAGDLFACGHCYDLARATQQLSARDRGISRARKIRMQLDGGPSIVDLFPENPRRLHLRAYERLQGRTQASEAHSYSFLMRYLHGSAP